MAQAVGLLGTLTMVVFLLLLAVRCLGVLGWVRLPGPAAFLARQNAPEAARPVEKRQLAAAFLAVLAFQWAVLFFGWLTLNQSGGIPAFLAHFWQRFTQAGDSPHYCFIAQNGYVASGEDAKWIVFYPLYPLCVRLVSVFTGGNIPLAGLVVSQLCLGGCGALMLQTARRWLPAGQAVWAVIFLAVYPFSFFGMGVYTESLFILLCLGCLDRAAGGHWVSAGLLGGLAAICRTQGMVLLLPVIWLILRHKAYKSPKCLGVLLIPAGWGVYLGCNWALFGNCFAFLEFEAAPPWYQTTRWIGENLTQHWELALQYPGLANFIYWPQIGLYFVTMALLLWGVCSGAPTEWLILGGAYLGMTYLSGWMISGPRYLFGCVPLFLLLARLPHKGLRWALATVSALALVAYGVLYLQAQAIM